MDVLREEILDGSHPIAKINKKETLRCINEASKMFRDTLRDPSEVDGESDAGSEHSDVTEVSPKKKKKSSRS